MTSRETIDRSLNGNKQFELLSAYIDGEVSEEERQQFEQHLSSDLQLHKQYREQLMLSQTIKLLSFR